jgi:hypothetical protein
MRRQVGGLDLGAVCVSVGPWPRQGKALSRNISLLSRLLGARQQLESQSVTAAAQKNGPLPPEAGPPRRLTPLELGLF